MKVLRGMTPDSDGLPKLGATARTLGVRWKGSRRDIDLNQGGLVFPGTGGMIVSPPPPQNLVEHRRPPEYGGTGTDPVFELETEELPPELTYRRDPQKPYQHGFIEPSQVMGFKKYQNALHATRELWKLF